MGLFNWGNFILHSGKTSDFKIDCDALSNEDIETLAKVISGDWIRMELFSRVKGIPRGGIRLASALEKYNDSYVDKLLIVDDVLTTGKSMDDAYERGASGVVIFACTKPAPWIQAVFRLW